ncbi:hypothetical protein BJX76DRAFT_339536 [Aspergillus varians]
MTTTLLPNTLYIAIFIRADPPIPDDFHWALYHPTTTTHGTKYHISNESNGWIAAHSRESPSSILKTFLLAGLIRVADVNTDTADLDGSNVLNSRIDTLLRSKDANLNDKDGVTCRTWLLEMLRLLDKEGLLRDVRCGGDVERLEREVKQWGNGLAEGAVRNVQPRPVGN